MILVWCTGISGSDRTAYVTDAASAYAKVPDYLKVGPNATALLDGNEDVLRLHRAYALKALKEEIEAAKVDLVIVSTHACFMRRGRVMPGLDMNFIKENLAGRIDIFATVIHVARLRDLSYEDAR